VVFAILARDKIMVYFCGDTALLTVIANNETDILVD